MVNFVEMCKILLKCSKFLTLQNFVNIYEFLSEFWISGYSLDINIVQIEFLITTFKTKSYILFSEIDIHFALQVFSEILQNFIKILHFLSTLPPPKAAFP
jgi:hypothetical protein